LLLLIELLRDLQKKIIQIRLGIDNAMETLLGKKPSLSVEREEK